MCDDFLLKHPFSCQMAGPSVSGNSSFCILFLQNLKALCTEPNLSGGIMCCKVRVVPSPLGSLPERNMFVFTKECQQTLTTVGEIRAS